jgi:peptide/nickel transport system permease protein
MSVSSQGSGPEEPVMDAPRALVARRRPRWLRPGNTAGPIFLTLVGLGVLASFTAGLWLEADPLNQNLVARLTPPAWVDGGSWEHPLGTDELGRDLLARVLYGGRISYIVGFVAATVSAVIGISLGILAGYRRRFLETVILRLVDVQTAFPFLIVAIAIVAFVGASLQTIIVTLIVWQWVPFARLAHAKTLNVKEEDYFRAAVATGRADVGIAVRHVLPNILPPLVVVWTFIVARSIIAESALSFLGLGVPPPTPTWGGMLSAGRPYLDTAWWIPLVPGLAIVFVVVAINVVGDWMSDRWDPRDR